MKINFNKISAVLASGLITVSGAGFAAAMFPTPFMDSENIVNHDFAVIYGSSAGALDSTPALSIGNYFKAMYDSEHLNDEVIVDYDTSIGITENEITLGGSIISGDIKATLTDNKIPNLFDGKINWDNGVDNEDFNVREEILIGSDKLKVITTLDDDEISETAMTNDKGLEYRYVFEETINTSLLDDEDADDFVINFLGEDMIIIEMNDDEITFTEGDRHLLDAGNTLSLNGKTILLESVYSDKVYVSVDGDARRIREGETARIQGVEVRLSEILYQNKVGGIERAELIVGTDIETTVSDGDAFPGEDEDDPKWVWSISDAGEADGYVGVRYNEREMDVDDDLVYLGESYVFPRNFAQVNLIGTTDVDYEDYEVSFDDSMDLYSKVDGGTTLENKPVLMIKGDTDESFEIGTAETNSIYLYHDVSAHKIGVYYKDVNEDISDSVRVRLMDEYNLIETFDPIYDENETLISNESLGYSLSQDVSTLVSDDTEFIINLNMDDDEVILSIGDIKISIGDGELSDGSFRSLGSLIEDAESDDIKVEDKSIGTREDDIMDYYGTVIKSPESNADSDEVILSVPSEQVYAKVAVLGSESVGSTNTIGNTLQNGLNIGSLIVKDNEIASVSNKNQIIVGGSCINAEAARLLGVPLGTCGEDFTTATGVNSGQYLLQTFNSTTNSEKVVVLIAGYHAADTMRGVNEFLASDLNITTNIKTIA